MANFREALGCFHASETIGWMNAVTVKAFIHPVRERDGSGSGYSYSVSAICGGTQRWTVCTVKNVSLATAKRRCSHLLKCTVKPKLQRGEF